MKNPIKAMMGRRPNSAADIENELARLGQKLADHQRRRSEVLQSLEEAKEARRAVLAEEDNIIAEATGNVRRLEADAAEHARMIEEYEAAIGGAEERFRQATDQEQRRAAAEKLEKTAAAVDAVAAELEKAVVAASVAARKMISAIPADLEVIPAHYVGRLDRYNREPFDRCEAVAAVVMEMLLAQCPEIVTKFSDGGYRAGLFRLMTPEDPQPSYNGREATYNALSGRKAVEALITRRLHERAAQTMAGERKADLADIKPVYKPVPKPSIPEVAIFPTSAFSYVSNDNGGLTLVGARWHRWVPEPVAKVAIARGIALAIDSPEGQKAYTAEKKYREVSHRGGNSSLTREECLPLGDIMGLAAERQRLDAEFAASQASTDEIAEEVARVVG